MSRLLQLTVILLTALVINTSCSHYRAPWKQNSPSYAFSTPEFDHLMKEGEKAWKVRLDKSSLLLALKYFELAFYTEGKHFNPTQDQKLLLATYLTRGHYLLGEYHEQDYLSKEKAFKSSGEWAERGFGLHEQFKKTTELLGNYTDGLKYLDQPWSGCLFWYAVALGKWSLNNGVNTNLRYADLLKALAARLQQVDKTYYYGGAYRILGSFYAAIPSYAGGNLNKSEEFFKLSLENGAEYLATKVLMAQIFAVNRQDVKLFRKLLKEVIDAQLSEQSDIYAENILEQRKAQLLLSQEAKLF